MNSCTVGQLGMLIKLNEKLTYVSQWIPITDLSYVNPGDINLCISTHLGFASIPIKHIKAIYKVDGVWMICYASLLSKTDGIGQENISQRLFNHVEGIFDGSESQDEIVAGIIENIRKYTNPTSERLAKMEQKLDTVVNMIEWLPLSEKYEQTKANFELQLLQI